MAQTETGPLEASPCAPQSPSRRPIPVLLRVPAGGQSLCSSESQQEACPCAPQSQPRGMIYAYIITVIVDPPLAEDQRGTGAMSIGWQL
ncbi:unnamed protein product [Knipowitschia caucasica]|uniref:Uncharacterized protein n=1 Tax=Knipowitschia caucasica TaxID=637954 RepID=A0AAV2M3Z9_KNICA